MNTALRHARVTRFGARIRAAGRKLVAERFLLPADAHEIESAADTAALP